MTNRSLKREEGGRGDTGPPQPRWHLTPALGASVTRVAKKDLGRAWVLSLHIGVSHRALSSPRPGSGLRRLPARAPGPVLCTEDTFTKVHHSVRRSFGETAGKAFWQLGLGDRNSSLLLSGLLRRGQRSAAPRHHWAPLPLPCSRRGRGSGERGRKAEAPGAAFLAQVRVWAPTLGPETGTGESPCWDRPGNAVLLPKSSGPPPLKATPARNGLPDLFPLRTMTATQLRGETPRGLVGPWRS